MTQYKQTKIDYTNVVIVGIALFIIGIIVGAILFPTIVFGLENTTKSLIPESYYITYNITKDAAHQTEGYLLDQFVASIDNSTNYTGLGEK